MKKRGLFCSVVCGLAALALVLASTPAEAAKVGQKLGNVKVRDGNDKPAWIPDLGKKVIGLFYTDPDVKEMNEPFREMLKAAKLDKSLYRGMGVVNLKDTWKPNFIIRKIIRGKIKKYKATILTDPSFILKNSWKLGDCNEKDVVIVIGKDKKIKYIKKGKMSKAEMKETLELIKAEMKK